MGAQAKQCQMVGGHPKSIIDFYLLEKMTRNSVIDLLNRAASFTHQMMMRMRRSHLIDFAAQTQIGAGNQMLFC